MKELKHSFLQVETAGGTALGGNQAWFRKKFLKRSACGVISAANVLLYRRGKQKLLEAEYMDFAEYLWKYYLPVIPGFGMNGLTLGSGLNLYFLKHRLPYRAFWGVSGKKMISRIDEMLERDFPVILAIGPNFPKFWGKETLNLYKKTQNGTNVLSTKTRAHFVTVIGHEKEELKISSWGKEYVINLGEYQEYIKKYSSPLVTNIICITAAR